ncbi:MAG: peptidoglycan editing factor PgeF [Bacillota bacterium]
MEYGFELKRSGDIIYYTIPSFEKTGMVRTCFTGRLGGYSKKPYDSLNMGFKNGDNAVDVRQNYLKIGNAIGLDVDRMVLGDQVHGDKVRIVVNEDQGKGITRSSDIKDIDGLITKENKLGIITVYADCVPIFILDTINKVIALAHAGWKGTVAKIGQKTLLEMTKAFGTKSKNCLAAIGPSIGKCCYEVDDQVIDKFNENFTNPEKFVFSKDNGKYMLDLWKANAISLEEMGILQRNITISNLCTQCNHDLLFSHRAGNGVTGRMAAIMWLI